MIGLRKRKERRAQSALHTRIGLAPQMMHGVVGICTVKRDLGGVPINAPVNRIRLSKIGAILVSKNIAQEIRREIEACLRAGVTVELNFKDVQATGPFMWELLNGLGELVKELNAEGAQFEDESAVRLLGMSKPLHKKASYCLSETEPLRGAIV